ncbi:MAG: multicopper oxidase family protein [Anaerolineales bacterium]
MSKQNLTRRDALKLIGLGAGAATFGGIISACSPYLEPAASATPFPTSTLVPDLPTSTDLDITLRAAKGQVNIFSDTATDVWHYAAQVNQGDPASVQSIPNSYLGPILHLQRGQNFRARLVNELSEDTIVHWHGLHVPAEMDGHPRYAIAPNATYDYSFRVLNRAGTYWFHPHPHQRTGAQAYAGMAGLFIVHDEEEAAAQLPTGEFDLPLIIQDRIFDGNRQLVYAGDSMNGVLGDTVLVNGQRDASLTLKPAQYRLRLLNGSNARIYKLAWNNDTPFTVIATDGGLLEKPIERNFITLAPGERVELWADFSDRAGQEIQLVSQPFSSGGGMGMMGSGYPQGTPFDILAIRFEGDVTRLFSRPSVLSRPNFFLPDDSLRTRRVEVAMQGMAGLINGRTFVMDEVASDERVRLGDLEIWEFANLGGGMGMMGMGMGGMMSQPHPMHIHGVQFQVIERKLDTRQSNGYESLSEGFINDGWKDTVLVLPGETVRVLVKFEDFAGMFLYHCHNLEHEDGGMMRNYEVQA